MSNILTKQDLKQVITRYVLSRQMCFNYETMQSGGWVWSMHPAMKKIYGDDEILRDKYRQYFQFYNCHPWCGNIILAACLAIEETKDPDATQTAVTLRTGLMGPLAGVGDAIIWVMLPTIVGSIAAAQAMNGSPVGWFLCFAANFLMWTLFNRLFYVAHDAGVSFVTSRQAELNALTEAASVLGLAVVGALVASTVSITFKAQFVMHFEDGDTVKTLQSVFDSIMPKFANVLAVGAIYWGLGKEGMTSTKMIFIVIIISVLLALLGIC